tara:strand:+ start:313 stop:639 length:327 start_codon:yes stop_codon:yes gene_type:complete
MKKKLAEIHKTELLTDKDFKNYYRPLKRSIKVTPRSENLDGDLSISMSVKEVFSGNITKFHFNDYWGVVEPSNYTFEMRICDLLSEHLKPLFWDIVEKNGVGEEFIIG